MNPFQPLESELLDSALRLSSSAGWNQTREDWARLARLNPAGVGVRVEDDEVRASYSVICHGNATAWIGMILVDPSYRGTGMGKAAFQAALDCAQNTGCHTLGLDATPLGEPIYLKHGFVATGPIVRWTGALAPDHAASANPIAPSAWDPAIAAFDTARSGADRSALLHDLATTDSTLFVHQAGGEISGYAFLRPGRLTAHLGPIVADTDDTLALLLHAVTSHLEGGKVICDVLCPALAQALIRRGLVPARPLKRMTRPNHPGCLGGPGVRAAAGFEWG